jgi:predicted CXXCH cytochrome family protein
MFSTRTPFRLLLGFLFAVALTVAGGSPLFAATLKVDDCIKCHTLEPQQIADDGAAHQLAINCLDCHNQHRPVSPSNIPSCADCHAGAAHYELVSCNGCHNPHKPLKVTLTGELKAECLTCHTQQGTEMITNPSMHAEVSCNYCHADTHGYTPDCTSCHQPHSVTMTNSDCAVCHAAHEPTVLAYPATTSDMLCASCHTAALNELRSSPSKHRDISCATCHSDNHPATADCSDCHGQPHASGIHARFPKCMDCHNTAHDLDNLR